MARIRKYIRYSIMVVIGLLICGGLYFGFNNTKKTSFVKTSRDISGALINGEIVKLKDLVVTYNKDGIRGINQDSEIVWDVVYQMQNPILVSQGDKIAIADTNGHIIYVMNTKGKLAEIDTALPISDIVISEVGFVGAVVKDRGVNWIDVYNMDNEKVINFRVSMEQTGYPMSISISPNGKLIGISFLNLNEGDLKTSIAFYNLGEVGQNQPNEYISGYNYADMLVPEIEFLDNQNAVAIADNRIMFYSGKEKPEITKEILITDNIQSVYIENGKVVLKFENISEIGRNSIVVYDAKGEVVLEKATDFEFSDLTIANKFIVMYNSNKCLVISLRGKEEFEGELGMEIKKLFATNEKYNYNLVAEETVRRIEIR